jgi:multimeric flavodoxin WrbA
MAEVVDKMQNSDLIVFSYPIYTFIAPSQLHRFIELLKENNVNLENKFVTQVTTSKHFYDVTAHKYIEENCYDMKMKYIKGLSLDMEDLLDKDKQQEIVNYLEIKCAEIDKLIADKTHLLEEMESYKKSVIYEYVTGKKQV